jgi:hypothetical protein
MYMDVCVYLLGPRRQLTACLASMAIPRLKHGKSNQINKIKTKIKHS